MDIRKLQRVIVDGLEDVKAQNIVVFNTEHLSPLFERVIVASGTSNRQTKSLAASVRDAVKAAGDPPPRTEGEDNGEWIIVDCGAAVVHVMQPAIRDYYHLEELWGDKPVKMKIASAAPRLVKAASHGDNGERPAARGTIRRSSAAERPASAPAAAKKRAPAKRDGGSTLRAGKRVVIRTHGREVHGRQGGPNRPATGSEEGGTQALSRAASARAVGP
jgi:ribosome-associated protein